MDIYFIGVIVEVISAVLFILCVSPTRKSE
jgi:hypothetical protein